MHRRVAPRMVPRACCAPGCSRASSSPPRAAPPTWRPPAARWARPRWRSRPTSATRTPSSPRACALGAVGTLVCDAARALRRRRRRGGGPRRRPRRCLERDARGGQRGLDPRRRRQARAPRSAPPRRRARRPRSAPRWRTRRGRCRSSGRATPSAPPPILPGDATSDDARRHAVAYLASPAGDYFSGCAFAMGSTDGLGFAAPPIAKEAALAGGRFGATVVIDRPIDEVFAFLADGENDPKFSSRVLEIAKTTDGPPGVGTVYASTVKDGGVKSKREFRLTEFEPPTNIRWAEMSTNPVTAPEGGYDLAPGGRGQTQLTFYNVLEGQLRQAHRRLRAALGAQGRRRLRAVDQARRSRARAPRPASAGRAARARWRRAGRGSAACWAAGARPRRAGRR